MARDFRPLAKLWVRTYGEEILKLPAKKMVEAANRCIDADLVPYMEPVKQSDGIKLVEAVQTELFEDVRKRAEADLRMPELTGSEKQVRWAKEIRNNAIEAARKLRQNALLQQDEKTALMIDAFVAKSLRKESRARWFIDLWMDYAHWPSFFKNMTGRVGTMDDVPVSAAEAEACEEMTLRPKVEKHEGSVIVSVWGGRLLALYRKDKDFLRVIRPYRLRWDPDVMGWRGRNERGRKLAADQIARLAAALVVEGFAVMVSSDEARSKAKALSSAY